MKRYYFIRHGRLDLPYTDHSDMPTQVLAELGDKSLNPRIDENFIEKRWLDLKKQIDFADIQEIYSSPLLRCSETSRILSELIFKEFGKRVPVKLDGQLREATFDLRKILPSSSSKLPIEQLNAMVLSAIFKGDNAEPVGECLSRIKAVYQKFIKDASVSRLFVTHDFFMRVIELYIRHQSQTDNLQEKDLIDTVRNQYLQGYTTTSDLKKFILIR